MMKTILTPVLTLHPRCLISLMLSLLQPSRYLTLLDALRLPPKSFLQTIPWMTHLPRHPVLGAPCGESSQFSTRPLASTQPTEIIAHQTSSGAFRRL